MEKQKSKNKETTRTATQLGCIGLAISFALLSVPIFCAGVYKVLFVSNYYFYETSIVILCVIPIFGILTAIGTARYTTNVMKLYRLSGVVSLTTIMSATVMIVTYLIATRIWEFAR